MLCKNAELFLEEAKRRGIEGIEVKEEEHNLQRAMFYQDLDNGIEMRNMVIFDSNNDVVVVSGMDFVTGVNMEKRYIIYDVLSQLNRVIDNFTYILKKGQIVIDSTYLVGGGDNFDAAILFDILIKMKAIVNRDAIHLIKLAH
ncbi:hypothetical protein CM240_0204 [Clostridium bornimense]|uniref:Uncharacterized protein n=1 Tax=Clostridium bornimense TaxID=1216932 RepID=W6RUT0_9CLOT|nr:hypothetical protein [Clostridium bornimense]CDM67374.1 hypothetical protein CM240_0204 [Clostridium bornimense]